MFADHKNNYRSKIRKRLSIINTTHLIAILALILAFTYGTLGFYCLRDEFVGIKNLTDSFYYTAVVVSTLGDNQIVPQTETARYFITSMVVFGFGIFATFFSAFFYQTIGHLNKIFKKLQGGKIHMKDHIVLCGYSVLTELLINKFIHNCTPFILLDNQPHPELNAGENGNYIYVSSPSKQENLMNANIEFCASFIASSDSDGENILAAINANILKKQYNASYKIITRILYEEHIEAAKANGATEVISPTIMAANAILNVL